jgi:protein-tyrosine phosphatase
LEFETNVIYSHDDGKPFLFLGGVNSSAKENLIKLGITHVLNVADELENDKNLTDIACLKLNVEDYHDEEIQIHFDNAHKFIRDAFEQKGTVLVHCYAGVSRSATIVLSYLMNHYKMSLMEAIVHTKTKRTIIHPNSGFIEKLIEYEAKLNGVSCTTTVEEYEELFY